jgi:zinc protease
MNLREDKGYSYGARGGFSYSKSYGTLSVSAPVQADSSYQSLLERPGTPAFAFAI